MMEWFFHFSGHVRVGLSEKVSLIFSKSDSRIEKSRATLFGRQNDMLKIMINRIKDNIELRGLCSNGQQLLS